MRLSGFARFVIVVAVVLGAALYLLLVDLGVNAGRIHRGVYVEDVYVGGLTVTEANRLLRGRGKQLQEEPVVFTTEGFDCRFLPVEVGWGPQPFDTARRAMDVGRTGGVAGVVVDRLDAWVGGVEVSWAGSVRPELVDEIIASCNEQARALGLELDETEFRRAVERAIVSWPRRLLPLPVSRA